MDPWYLYLNNTTVKRKTSNYYKISGELILDVVIQAAPTQFGHAIVQLVPQGTEFYAPPYTQLDSTLGAVANDLLPTMWQSTQDIYGDLVPATSEALEFRLPWISPQDHIDLTTMSTTGTLGGGPQTQWRFLTHCVVPLGNATNMASIGSVTIRVYARLENVKLAIPLSLQTGEKKKKQGQVGKFASAVSSVASVLKTVPIVGEFAAGVEVVSNAVGAIADWFGFTRTTSSDPAMRVRQDVFPGLPNADGVDTSSVLAMLVGNKVSIDTAIFGSGEKVDIESFADLFRRKTLVNLLTWTTAMAPGAVLIAIPVAPFYCRNNGFSVDHWTVYPSPVALIQTMFHYWRGPMYYEIQVRCSNMHRGMLQVDYQPNVSFDGSDPTNTSYNKVFEIGADAVHTFRVGWAQNVMWRKTAFDFNVGSADFNNDTLNNGMINLRVFTALTAPDPAASFTVEIYVFSDENMTFMSPVTPSSILRLQSGLASANMTELSNLVGSAEEDAADITAISGGERIQSVRTILQRPYPHFLLGRVAAFVANLQQSASYFLPLEISWLYGASANAHPGILAEGWTPATWITQMYLGWRGSIRTKVITLDGGVGQFAMGSTQVYGLSRSVYVAALNTMGATEFLTNGYALGAGFVEANSATNASAEVVSPYYVPMRYNISRVCCGPSTTSPMQAVGITLNSNTPNTALINTAVAVVYRSMGPDFSLGRFRFVQRMQVFET